MFYHAVIVCVLSGVAGIKKPIYGGLAGLFLSPLIHVIFYKFDLFIFSILLPAGFIIGIFFGSLVNGLFFGSRDDDRNSKPYYRPVHKSGGGIVYTNEEEKNAKENEERIK
ncbi:MAG: hypothetical protein OQL18_02765 [Deltaproteobacteria bacterium]|jgi:hypothetical protein|nr:hypothetical protein [Deltaproteobacteria bacterium]